jgi:pimeloyl-ACP methyl ester carboxylesterase
MKKSIQVLAALLCSAACTVASAQSLRQMSLGADGSYKFSFYSNKTVGASMPAIKRVVIVQHGVQRDGNNAFSAANAALHNSGAVIAETLLVAPQFWNESDASAGKVPASTPYWSKADWSIGLDSTDGRNMSSFTVIDDLVRKFANAAAYPNVTQIVVAGHSAGAQMYSRYAAFNTVHEKVRSGILVKYVLANAGTYMYFNDDRPLGAAAAGASAFAPSSGGGTCPGFDEYKYGSASFPINFRYPHTLATLDRFKRFAGRKTYYYQGTADTASYTSANGPDANCAAVLSGNHRLARGITNARYQRYLAASLAVPLDRIFRRVEGVAHDEARMWGAECVTNALFGASDMLISSGARCTDLN